MFWSHNSYLGQLSVVIHMSESALVIVMVPGGFCGGGGSVGGSFWGGVCPWRIRWAGKSLGIQVRSAVWLVLLAGLNGVVPYGAWGPMVVSVAGFGHLALGPSGYRG